MHEREGIFGAGPAGLAAADAIGKLGYKNHLRILQDYLQTVPGLQAIGRCGALKYSNQNHSMFMGILAAEKIAFARNRNL